jgi:hypothetical protein
MVRPRYFFFFFLIACFSLSGGIGTPAAEDNGKEPIRYPTLIKAKYESGAVEISFETVDVENAVYRIYRSSSPLLSPESLAGAEAAAEVTAADLPYRDAPERDGRYYYAVIAVIQKEQLALIPYQNTTLTAVSFTLPAEQVESIEVRKLGGNRVAVRFKPLNPSYAYNLYASSGPIAEIGEAAPAASAAAAPAGKFPEAAAGETGVFELSYAQGTPYYFAVTAVSGAGVENRVLTPGRNSTLEPFIEKPEEKKVEGKKKEPPKAAPVAKAPAVITHEELIDGNLRSNFFKGDYSKALVSFSAILEREELSPRDKSTVHFYMGQCYFYLGEYKRAVRSFILSKEDPGSVTRSEPWIDRCLERVY